MTFSKTVAQLSACFGLVGIAPIKKRRIFNPTYNHVVADVAERGLLEDVLHETVPRGIYLQRVAGL